MIKWLYNMFRSQTEKGYNRLLQWLPESPVMDALRVQARRYPSMSAESHSDLRYSFIYLPVYDELKAQYPLEEKAGRGDTFSRAINLMSWLCANTKYNGMSMFNVLNPKNHFMKLMRYAFRNTFSHAINCAAKAIALSDCLMATGIYAMPVWLTSSIHDVNSKLFGNGECHVVTHVWLPEDGRWVMLDPSFDSYISDENGRVLDLVEIYERSAADKALEIARYNFNGSQFFREHYLRSFLLPCLFELSTWKGSAPELRKGIGYNGICVVPEGFDIKGHIQKLTKLRRYRKHYKNSLKNLTLISREQFLSRPAEMK